jgi:transcription termination/antitermination protein NusG
VIERGKIMSATNDISYCAYGPSPDSASLLWLAVHTYPRHEKRVASMLTLKAIDNYLPIVTRLHAWSDRRKKIDLPLFPNYVFVHIHPSAESRVGVLQVPGVVQFVGCGKQIVPIPPEQIENIRTLLANKIALDPYPFLKLGQRVRIRGGALDGVEGVLVRRNGTRRLIISVDSLERSLSMCVEGLDVEGI